MGAVGREREGVAGPLPIVGGGPAALAGDRSRRTTSRTRERRKKRQARKGSPEQGEGGSRAGERRRHRYPVPAKALPPIGHVLMTHLGAAIFADVTGELAEESVTKC